MSTYLSLARFAATALALGAVGNLHATPIPIYGQNLAPANMVSDGPLTAHDNFLLNLSNVGTETFEERTLGPSSGLDITFTGSTDNKTATITGGGDVAATSTNQANDKGRFNTTGTAPPPTSASAPLGGQWWDTSASMITIEFHSPISAFGFYGTDFGDFGGRVTVALDDIFYDDLTIQTCPDAGCSTNLDNAALVFWGFYDTEKKYSKITFATVQPADCANLDTCDYFGFDDMVIGDAPQSNGIPEPATLMLAGLGLLGLAATRRKQQH